MGLRINLQHANYLAHVFQPSGSVRPLRTKQDWEKSEVFHEFLHQLGEGFYSGRRGEKEWRQEIRTLADAARDPTDHRFAEALERVRYFLGDRPWTALLVPAGRDSE